MAIPVVVSRIQNRRGTQDQFNGPSGIYPLGYDGVGGFNPPGTGPVGFTSAAYPNVLMPGEIALCTDTRRIFIGNLNGEYEEFLPNHGNYVIGPLTVTDSNLVQFDGTTGALIKGGLAVSTDGTFAANSDSNIPTQKAVKTALDLKTTANAPITPGTATKITFDANGFVTAGTNATTADINDSPNRRYVTDAELVVITNTSGVNTGDQNLSGYEQLVHKNAANGYAGLDAGTRTAKSQLPAGIFIIPIAAGDETSALTTGTAKVTFHMPAAMTVTEVRGSVNVAQATGALLTFDVKLGGVSIFSTTPTFNNTSTTTVGATTPAVISTSALTNDGTITIDITQVGDGTAKGLKVYLIGTYA